jgi:hypothetical protein
MDFLENVDDQIHDVLVSDFKRLAVLVDHDNVDTVKKGILKTKGFKDLELSVLTPHSQSFPARFDAVLVYHSGGDTDEILGNLI